MSARPARPRRGLAAALLALGLGGCAGGLRGPATPLDPAAGPRLARDCPAGTFLGTMTINCPQRVD